MVLKMDKELSLEEIGLYSIMTGLPEANSATAEYLSKFSSKMSYTKFLWILESLVTKGYITKNNNIYTVVPNKSQEFIKF